MTGASRHAPPRAGAMLEALRGFGYTTASALADIIDNSISAGAFCVRIRFEWDGGCSRISVLDDGRGMSDAELQSAMTLGSINPLDPRSETDLGRFGMGLKTASFSQCRCLTVTTRTTSGELSCLRWDLDAIAADPADQWRMFEGPRTGSESFAELPGTGSGTLVLWEQMDRIVTPGYGVDDYADLVDDVESRLAMVFHRLIEGPRPVFRLFINDHPVAPWDPFMIGHPAKPWESPVTRQQTPGGEVELQCHVLPHKDRLSDHDFERAGGPDGWNTQQGFYVYRNHRLLLAGGWLGLGRGRSWNREEAYRLARASLNIPNTADADWKIDVKKSTALPPVYIRAWLTRFAEDTRDRARRVFAYRGSTTSGSGAATADHVWQVEQLRGGIRYRIDERHPSVTAVMEACGENSALIRAMLRVVEETVPVQRIWLDTAEHRDIPRIGFSGEPETAPEGVRAILVTLYKDMTGRRGMSKDAALSLLSRTEPFHNYPGLVTALPEIIAESDEDMSA